MATDPEAASLPDGAPAPLGESLLAEHAAAASTSATAPTIHAAGRPFRILFLLGLDRASDLAGGVSIGPKLARQSWPDPDTEMNG